MTFLLLPRREIPPGDVINNTYNKILGLVDGVVNNIKLIFFFNSIFRLNIYRKWKMIQILFTQLTK